MKSFFIFAGEASGDLHGSHLIKALKHTQPDCTITAVAGPRMRNEDVKVLMPMENFEVMGFTDVFRALPSLYKQFYQVRDCILKGSYDAVILIDYPGFNLRLAKALRKKGFSGKIVQYVAPTVWAHGRGRIAHMAATLDLLLTIYPFETQYFAATPLPVCYIGNPLQEYQSKYEDQPQWREKVGMEVGVEFVALFPGSRAGELKRNLPVQLQAASHLKRAFPQTKFAISCTHPQTHAIIKAALKTTDLSQSDIVLVPKEYTYEMMQECRTAIAKSGTVTLELALREKPTVVTYVVTMLNKFIAKCIIRVNLPHYCIVNILTNQTTFPEFVESRLPIDQISQELLLLHEEGENRQHCIEKCRELKVLLGHQTSSESAAEAVGALFYA